MCGGGFEVHCWLIHYSPGLYHVLIWILPHCHDDKLSRHIPHTPPNNQLWSALAFLYLTLTKCFFSFLFFSSFP